MAWGYQADCPNCGHHWEDTVSSLSIGPWSANPDDRQDLYCRSCHKRLCFPRSVERNAWRQWYKRFLAESSRQSPWLLDILATIEASLATTKWYDTHPITLTAIDCPRCNRRMAPSSDEVECPACGNFAWPEYYLHVLLQTDKHGFD